MGKSRTSKTISAGMALGLTIHSKQFGGRKGGAVSTAAPNRMMRRMLKDKSRQEQGKREIKVSERELQGDYRIT